MILEEKEPRDLGSLPLFKGEAQEKKKELHQLHSERIQRAVGR